MIWHDVEQNTPEWLVLRLGIPTASEFHRIITPKKLKLAAGADEFMYRLLAEWITGEQVENFESKWMERGHEFEPKARSAYELLTGAEVTNGGFFTTDDGLAGCSPDGLVGNSGDLELKSPLLHTQVGYALTGSVGDDYMAQLQGRLMIHEREWVDIFPYHPRLLIPPLRVYRDEEFIAKLSEALSQFVEKMVRAREELEKRFGPFVRMEMQEQGDSKHFLNDGDVDDIVARYQADGVF